MADTAGASLESPPQDFEDRQTQKFTGAVGNSLPLEAILNLYDFFVDARPPKKYEDFSRIRFVYEILYKDEWKEKVKHIACTWLEVCYGPCHCSLLTVAHILRRTMRMSDELQRKSVDSQQPRESSC